MTRSHSDLPLKTALREADEWDARAAEARKGFLLYNMADIEWHFANETLVNACQAAGRITHVQPMADRTYPLPTH